MPIGDPCDRHASANAYTAWYRPRDRRIVVLCAHCAHEHGLALTAQGFELSIDERATLLPKVEVVA